ncbi:MAG: CDP-archaeol synthase, partial [Pseudomonadota bacterium]|nr:CDP-archaeol synthase [Pseudomonadota bacterium]
TALVILPIFFLPIYLGGIFFKIALICVSALFFYELITIINHTERKVTTMLYLFFLCLSLFILKIAPDVAFSICLAALVVGSILIKLVYKSDFWFQAVIGYSYLSFLVFYQIRLQSNPTDGLISIFLVLLIAFISDSFGYFGGQLFGRKKIFPYISPNKTLEGTLFAFFMPPIFIFFLALIFEVDFNNSIIYIFISIMALGAILGDLIGSYFKRNFNVKNSSNLLPGHGGLLDRMDSIVGVGIFFIILDQITRNNSYENILYFWR